MSAPCCPPGSLGLPFEADTKPKGSLSTIPSSGDIPSMLIYQSPTSKEKSSKKKAIVVFSDVFGFDAGNHRLFCDALSEGVGEGEMCPKCLYSPTPLTLTPLPPNPHPDIDVFLPDLFRGNNAIQPLTFLPEALAVPLAALGMLYRLKFTYTVETTIHVDVGRLIIPYLRSLGYESLGCVGFCFGGWAVAQCLALESSPFSAGVGIHPSLNVEDLHRRSVADLAKRVGKTPLLLLPAGNDKREVKPGGVAVRILAESRGVDESEISVEFPDQIHGFVSRGEPSEDQKRAIDKSTEHFIKHLS